MATVASGRIAILMGPERLEGTVIKGFRNFLMRGDVIVVAIGLIVALAFSTLIAAFTASIINPLVSRAEGKRSLGLGVQLGHKGNAATFLNFGAFISAVIYFVIFMAVLYFVIVLPYKHVSARRGNVVFGDPAPVKTCPQCLSTDLPVAALKCKYCGSEQPGTGGTGSGVAEPTLGTPTA